MKNNLPSISDNRFHLQPQLFLGLHLQEVNGIQKNTIPVLYAQNLK